MPSTRGRDPAVEEEFLGALYKGGELLASGKIVEAREHLEKAHGLAPKNEKAQNLLGLAYFKLGLFDRASEVYEKLVNENPADATLRVNLGLVYLKTNNLERSIKEFETATDLEPTHKKAHNYLGLALAQQGTYAKAKEHFELAGSDQMAEKMGRAISNQSSPSGIQRAPEQKPKTVVLGGAEEARPASPPPPPRDDDAEIEVMSDDAETPSEAFAAPLEEAPPPPPRDALADDWGATLPSAPRPPAPPSGEMKFAEDEGPSEDSLIRRAEPEEISADQVEEMPVLDAVVEVMPIEAGAEAPLEVLPETPLVAVEANVEVLAPTPSAPSPEWLTAEGAEAPPPAPPPQPESTGWVTETVADVPLEAETHQSPAQQWSTTEAEASWSDSGEPSSVELAPASAADESMATAPAPSESGAPSEVGPADDESWATGNAPSEAAALPDQQDAANDVAPTSEATLETPATTGESWTSETGSSTAVESASPPEDGSVQPTDDESWATGATEAAAQPQEAQPDTDESWTTNATESPVEQQAPEQTWDGSSAAAEQPAQGLSAEDPAWSTGATGTPPEQAAWADGATEAISPEDEAAWAAAQAAAEQVPPGWQAEAPLPSTPDDDSWAVGASSGAAETVEVSAPPPPEPSAPLPITVEEPAAAPEVQAPYVPVGAPAGYSAMTPQRLVDLGASGNWVQEPGAGPFHLSADGLAVTVAGEMLMRMAGLIAVVGSIDVKPENRRRRGRPSQDPFGQGPNQLQRVMGNGVVYLEPGRTKFHAVDLTDQNGVNIDDDGAYLREELVFAFEEPISFENGKLSNDAQSLELAHLKGTGRVLLALDGSLKAMPIPLGAPLVVPVQRVVGWFGRVNPRLMGFGGRGAVELTGEGYALLGTPG